MTSSLREFLVEHRNEVLLAIEERVRNVSPGRDERELAAGFDEILGEIISAFERDPSMTGPSPLSDSAVAARMGGQRQKHAFGIHEIPEHLGAISESVSRVASRYDLEFDAWDYRTFNMCVDGAVSAAVEAFSSELRRKEELETTRRIGFLAHELRNAISTARLAFSILKTGEVTIAEPGDELPVQTCINAVAGTCDLDL
jgi:hypothetical protein